MQRTFLGGAPFLAYFARSGDFAACEGGHSCPSPLILILILISTGKGTTFSRLP
jgi:hypothetical protein